MGIVLLIWISLFLALAWGTNLIKQGYRRLAQEISGKKSYIPGGLLLVLTGALPELFIAIAALVEKRPEISLANLLGANVVDLSLVVGVAALVAGTLPIMGDYWRFELSATFLAGVAPILLMLDGSLSRLDGAILVVIYLIYLEELVIDGREKSLVKEGVTRNGILSHVEYWSRKIRGKEKAAKAMMILEIMAGLVLMMVSAVGVVRLTVILSGMWSVPVLLVSLAGVSLGTSLPEILAAIPAARKRKVALVLGNLLGSVVTNSTLIVGILALVSPFKVASIGSYALVNMGFVVIFGLFWLFSSTKRKLEKFEGVILTGLFLCYWGLTLIFGT